MANPKPSQRDRLLEQQRQLAAKLAALDAREKTAERKLDTRRKILIGGAVLESLRRGDYAQDQLAALLDKALVHDRDRQLFDFLDQPTPEPDGERPSPASAADSEPAATTPDPPADPAPEPRSSITPSHRRFHHNPSPRKEDYI